MVKFEFIVVSKRIFLGVSFLYVPTISLYCTFLLLTCIFLCCLILMCFLILKAKMSSFMKNVMLYFKNRFIGGLGNIALLNKYLMYMKPWVPFPNPHKLGLGACTNNTRTLEVEAGVSEVQDHPQPHSELEASLDT